MRFHRIVEGVVLTGAFLIPCPAFDKPTGAPLVMSSIETEQPIPLAVLAPDGKTASCVYVRLHWSPSASVTSDDDTISFALDVPPENPSAAIFTAQLWSASLASSLAWQKPWQGAHWKVLQVPATDGTGIDAALAVGMISTSARRPYPKDTLVIGNLHPDGSLGSVSRLSERLDAAAQAGISRVIIPKIQQFETEASGQLTNIMRHASELHLTCIPVDNIVEATEVTMNDPLPDPPVSPTPPKYSSDVAAYIDDFARREQTEASSGLLYAPRQAEISHYPPRQAAIWRQVYAEINEGQEAYHSGQVYVAYRLLARANSRMRGMNALTGQDRTSFDVKAALATSDSLHRQLHDLMTPPSIDHAELQSAMLIAEMDDWAYDIDALLEGSELVTKQTFSQRSDATLSERDHARETILSANEEAKYLLNGADFYLGLLPHLGEANPMPANTNAAHLLPQLIPAQLANAELFTNGLRPHANEMRDGLLFDPRLAAYVSVLREAKEAWDLHSRRKMATVIPPSSPANSTLMGPPAPVPVVTHAVNNAPVGFDPGNIYAPPRAVVDSATPEKKLSEVAQCLIWVNTDCEIETLDAKYLRLTGTLDPATREWHVKDRSQLDALLQLSESGAREGIAFAQQAQVDPSIFSMIMERAEYLRLHGDDSSALDGLRNYWRCALLGNMCWQLAHTRKAAAVDLSAEEPAKDDKKKDDKPAAKAADQEKSEAVSKPAPENNKATTNPASTNVVATPAVPSSSPAVETNSDQVVPVEPAPANVVVVPAPTPASEVVATPAPIAPAETPTTNAVPVPVAPIATIIVPPAPAETPTTNAVPVPPAAAATEPVFPRALPVEDVSTNAPPAPSSPAAPETGMPDNVPVAPVAKDDVYTGGDSGTASPPVAQPVNGPASPTTNGPAVTTP
jgi:hypothetical protein